MTIENVLSWLNENKEWLLTIPATVIGWFAAKKLMSQRSDRGSVSVGGDVSRSKIRTANASGASTINQAENMTIQGVTFEQAESIASKTFEANYPRLVGDAADIALLRATDFARCLFNNLQKSNPEALEKIRDPDFAESIFEAQRRYAVSGDEDLYATLIGLLTNLSDAPPRSLRQISIKEAINCSAKITANQMNILALIFVVRHVRWEAIYASNEIAKFADEVVAPFLGGGAADYGNYSHLSSLGCLEIGSGAHEVEVFFMSHWRTALTKGIPKEELNSLDDGSPGFWKMFEPHSGSETLFQFSAQTNDQITALAESLEIDQGLKSRIFSLDSKYLLKGAEQQAYLQGLHPAIAELWTVWKIPNTALPRAHLNPLGVVLAHAHMARTGVAPGPLSSFVTN